MLNRLRLANFKAWREADLTFGKVTGFFGTNSAGKSSLLHLLLLLKQTRNATDRSIVLDFGGPGDMVNLGIFEDVVHQRDKRKTMSWLLEWTLPETLQIKNPMSPQDDSLFTGDRLQTRCEVGFRNKRLWPLELVYRFADVDFRLHPRGRSKQEFELADGEMREIEVGQTWVRVGDREVITLVLFNDEGSMPLLGALTLEGVFMGVDPVHKRLVPIRAVMA